MGENEEDLRVGYDLRVPATDMGSVDLVLPSGLVLVLHNVFCVPACSRNLMFNICT